MTTLLVLPLLLPALAAAASLLFRTDAALQRRLAVAGCAFHLLAGLSLLTALLQGEALASVQIGSWPAPYGITLVADLFSALMVVVTGAMGLAVAVYSLADIDPQRTAFGYYPLFHFLLMGVTGAFLTGDLFNLYVWFEVMLMASFVLLALGSEPQQIRGSIIYVTLNLLASALFLAAIGILYGLAGTLNLADLGRKLAAPDLPSAPITAVAMLLLTAFGLKAAMFPLFFWLPASYHTPPVAVAALFAGLLTKVGVYALIRVFTLLFLQDPDATHSLILVLSAATMVCGVLGAAAQFDFRRILSFHIISQIGYMTLGLGLFGLVEDRSLKALALAGSIFYILHHIVVKTNLFLLSGVAQRLGGSFDLKSLGGLAASHPLTAALFLIPAFSLAGIPPLSGFFAKLALIRAGLMAEHPIVVFILLAVGLLTLYSMTKIWAEVFWKAASGSALHAGQASRTPAAILGPIVVLATTTVVIGLAAEPLFDLATRAAEQLIDRDTYIRVVLGEET